MLRKYLLLFARISFISAMLVVFAGSFVRMTGSGMGCPDWPKCFGHYIPPTDVDEVIWHPRREYKKGMMIIRGERLWSAREDIVSTDEFNPENWEVYDKHDYAEFNVYHTYTEYINRLTGAFTGIPVTLAFLLSLIYVRRDLRVTLYGILSLFLLGFAAWLGKLVVDGNLIPYRITIHMIGALALLKTLVLLITRLEGRAKFILSKAVYYGGWIVATLSFVQIMTGTGVREAVDTLLAQGINRTDIIENLPSIFEIHRTSSLVILALNAGVLYLFFKCGYPYRKRLYLWLALLLSELAAGIVMMYGGFPAFMQPVHLILAFLLFMLQLYVMLGTRYRESA